MYLLTSISAIIIIDGLGHAELETVRVFELHLHQQFSRELMLLYGIGRDESGAIFAGQVRASVFSIHLRWVPLQLFEYAI